MATKSKNLRTGRSYWESRSSPEVTHRELKENIETDVLIVGAGISGAMIADLLSAAGLKVVVADTRGPAKGSTTASTALVQYEIDKPIITLSRKIGRADAMRAWRRSRLAVDALAARLAELDVPDIAWRESLYLAGDVLGPSDLEREHNLRRQAGLASRFLSRDELRHRFGIVRPAALLGFGNITMDPRKTTLLLLRAAIRRGVTVFAPTEIVDVDARRSGVIATAKNGRRIDARHLVFASGYEFPKGVPPRGHSIASTWAIATVSQPERLWPGQCTIWEASDPYLYIRTTTDGRVICGGEDEEFSDASKRDELIPRKIQTLRKKLKRLLPKIVTRVDFAWAGSFGLTPTGLPTIGAVPRMPNCFVALGYGGNGITYSRIAAEVICGALTGRPDVDADLYGFPRPRK